MTKSVTRDSPNDVLTDKPNPWLNAVVLLGAVGVSVWLHVYVRDGYFWWGLMVNESCVLGSFALYIYLSRKLTQKIREAVVMALFGVILGGWFGCGIFYAQWQTARMVHDNNYYYPPVWKK